MAEPSDTPNSDLSAAGALPPPGPNAAPPARPPRRRRWPALLALLLLLLLVAALGAGYYLWQRLQLLEQRQAQLAPAAELESRAGELAQANAELRTQLEAVAQEAAATERTVTELRQQLGNVSDSQRALAERIDVNVKARRGEWIRAEAAYLANVANYRLRFYGDVEGALAALRQADQLLAQLDSEAIKSRQAVNQAIGRLVTVNAPDLNELAARLEELISKVDILPLDLQIREADAQDQAASAAPPAEGWRGRVARAWERFKATLGELVIVRRDRGVEPLIVPEERYFLYHNLRLRLEAARLSLIDRNEIVYRRSLSRAQEWIERYHAQGEPEVEQALAVIRQLRQVIIDPELPDIAPILQPVTSY